MRKIEREVLEIGALFEGRLPPAVLADALDYIHFNEAGLALETLCQQLIEYDVKIAGSEYARLRSMEGIMYPDSTVLKRLAQQVIK